MASRRLRSATRGVPLRETLISAGLEPHLAELLDVSRQTVSNHLACLRGCGLVVGAPVGRRVRYALADPRLAHALDDLGGVIAAVDPQLCHDEPVTEDCC